MKFQLSKQWIKSFLLMLVSVICMGFGVSLLVLTRMGTDPCSAMNYGVAGRLGLSFGTYQLMFNAVLLVIVFVCKRSMIGTGTLGNMVLVGYSADFFGWLWRELFHIPAQLSLPVRIGILIPTLLVFVVAAACYIHSGRGMAPYDAVPFILAEKIEKRFHKNCLFPIRVGQDLLATVIGYVTGGEVGVMTVMMIVLLGSAITCVGRLFKRWHILEKLA